MIAFASGTATARYPLVARLGDVLEVDAARVLQQVSAGRGKVAELARGSSEQGLGEQGIACANGAIGREVAVAHHRPDADAPTGERFDAVIGKVGDIDQQIRLPPPQPQMVNEVGPASEEDPVGRLGEERDGAGRVAGTFIAEGIHRRASSSTRCASCACWTTSLIAGTILAYAAQRQRLPLMRSRVSSSSSVTCSALRSALTALGQPASAPLRIPTAQPIS